MRTKLIFAAILSVLALGPPGLRADFVRNNLVPAETEVQWEGWEVKITKLYTANEVDRGYGGETKAAPTGSVFVRLDLIVQNNNDHGVSFIPQNSLKIVIGKNSFDAEDCGKSSGPDDMENIQPTLVRDRHCYFELPTALVQQGFILRLTGFLESSHDIQVALNEPIAEVVPTRPMPTPVVQATVQAPTVEATPVPRLETATPVAQTLFILDVEKAVNSHDWQTLINHTADGFVNYFGRVHTSNGYIQRDMEQDARTYSSAHSTRYLSTFTHEVSSEYSSRWNGPMLYDSIDVYTEIQERHGRLHRATSRFSVGYTLEDGVPTIYSLTQKVL